ncbi:hypothetical protein ACUOFC_56495, partial [Escherichia sp. TWPC-MK]
EMQTTAALAESRRKMQARRRLKNRIALTLSMATMAFGLFWLIWILMSTITRGIDGMSLALFTEMTPPPNTVFEAATRLHFAARFSQRRSGLHF